LSLEPSILEVTRSNRIKQKKFKKKKEFRRLSVACPE